MSDIYDVTFKYASFVCNVLCLTYEVTFKYASFACHVVIPTYEVTFKHDTLSHVQTYLILMSL